MDELHRVRSSTPHFIWVVGAAGLALIWWSESPMFWVALPVAAVIGALFGKFVMAPYQRRDWWNKIHNGTTYKGAPYFWWMVPLMMVIVMGATQILGRPGYLST